MTTASVRAALLAIGSILLVASQGRADDQGKTPPVVAKEAVEIQDKQSPADPDYVVLWKGGARIPSIDITTKGTLLAFAQKGGGDNHPNNIEVCRSTDGGKTWSTPQDLTRVSRVSHANPSSIVDRDTGIVWLFWAVRESGTDGKLIHQGMRYRTSRDDGLTWSEIKLLTIGGQTLSGYSSTCRGIQLSTGRLLLPYTAAHSTGGRNVAKTIYSDDHGKTWMFGKEPENIDPWKHIGSIEYTVLELADGRIYMNHRYNSRDKCRAICFSVDGGISWSDPVEQTDLPQPTTPGCHSGLIRLTHPKIHDKSRVLLSSPFGEGRFGRENLTIQISYDECKTWKPLKVIQTGNASYSNLIVLPDGSIGCIYEFNDLDQKIWQRILFCRFTLEWLTNDKDGVVATTK